MAVSDIININSGAFTTVWTPALGVEIIVLKVFTSNDVNDWGYSDGVITTSSYIATVWVGSSGNQGGKYGITNSFGFYTNAAGAARGFSGIQIK